MDDGTDPTDGESMEGDPTEGDSTDPTKVDPTKVDWHAFDQAAFDLAASTDRPILLALMTAWSPECREMDATTYAEPRIAANIDEDFVPIRVDADRQPRVRERYNMGGFPSTVFLTPDGEILAGATYLGVDGFRGILDSVRRTWQEKGEDAGSVPRALQDARPPAGRIDEGVEEHMVEQLLAAYDEEFGGWGSDVKFPLARTIEFALVRAREQALRTLEAIRTHLYDTYDGGFYRYGRNRNWRNARREKLTEENAALVRVFAFGYRYTGEEAYREVAEGAVDYLTTTLWTGEAFGASQGGDEKYFRLEAADREEADAPPVDGTVYADRNGLAIDGLLTLARYTDDESTVQFARRAREFVCENLVDGGRVAHYDAESDGGDVDSGLLVDQARVLQGLTTSWSVLGEPGPVTEVADWTLENLQADSGAFHDGTLTGPGLLNRALYPLDTTVECASALLDLSLLAGEEHYREAARDAMESFAGASDRMGVEVAHFGSVASRLLAPQALEVGAPAGSDLHRAALRLADHETVVVPDAGRDGREPVGSEPVSEGTARLVVDGDVTAEASSPSELESVLTD